MLAELLLKWPLIRQLKTGADGTGAESMSDATRHLRPRNEGAKVARSICPYCGVGCGQLVYHRNGELINIEGDPQSPISRGHLCPKGAASFELVTHPGRAIVFFVVQRGAAEVGHAGGMHDIVAKGSLTRLPRAVGHHVHRLLEIDVHPVACGRYAIFDCPVWAPRSVAAARRRGTCASLSR